MDSPATSDSVVELVFTLSDSVYPFVGLSAEEDCRVELQRMLPREEGAYSEFFSVDGADPDRVVELAEEHARVHPTVLARYEDGGLFEFVVSDGCPARRLAGLGALPREVESSDGEGRIVAEVPPGQDAGEVVSGFLEDHASAELVVKREKDQLTPLLTRRDLDRALADRLTDRQREVLEAAYEAGYYERPRETSGAEIADALGISSATFSQHIRVAERNLLSILYEDRAI